MEERSFGPRGVANKLYFQDVPVGMLDLWHMVVALTGLLEFVECTFVEAGMSF